MGVRGELFSTKVSSEKRTYFFNVKENRNGDAFLNIVESKKEGEGDYERHQIMVYQEEIELFVKEFEKAAAVLKKHKDVARPAGRGATKPRPAAAAGDSSEKPARRVVRKSKGDDAREPPRPTYELDGKWQGPESMKASGGKVTRISRKQIEERSASKAEAKAETKPKE